MKTKPYPCKHFPTCERKEAIQESLREQRKKMSEPKEEIRPATKLEKINILKNGLESKSGMFADAIKNYL